MWQKYRYTTMGLHKCKQNRYTAWYFTWNKEREKKKEKRNPYLDHFSLDGIYVHTKAVMDKVADGIKHDSSHAIGSLDRVLFYESSGIISMVVLYAMPLKVKVNLQILDIY